MAKMRLEPFALESDVDEALRLFGVSTLNAAMSGSLTGGWLGKTCVMFKVYLLCECYACLLCVVNVL